jgi:hypothetical protein
MGWDDMHLHELVVVARRYGVPDDEEIERAPGDDPELLDEAAVSLGQVARRKGARLLYVYDFGDDWQHAIVVEDIVTREPGRVYPVCLDGRRAGPPEDCGGPFGYDRFLEAPRDPHHREHADMVEWIGGSFDPEAFDVAAVNRELDSIYT